MKVAIIGGSGFIGSYVAEILRSMSIEFEILDIKQPKKFREKWLRCDIRDKQSLYDSLLGITHIINLAAEHKDDVNPVELYYSVNVDGAKNICDVASEMGINSILFTSSVAVYGLVNEETDELGALNPFNHYGISKMKAEKIYEYWQKNNTSNRLTIIRPTVVFGIGNRGNVYNLFKQISSGKFVMIGSGNNKKSMAYVENLSAFICSLINSNSNFSLYNYVDKPDYTMNELAGLISNTLDKKYTSFKIPSLLGLFVGYAFDFLAVITSKKYNISSVRIKKFCASTQFKSKYISDSGFSAPENLEYAIRKTVKAEFLTSNK